MKLFLIRHGETEHNVAGLLAGVTDSILTNHGVLQTQRLATYLTTGRNLRFTQLFASDLQRAYMTAEAVRDAQLKKWHGQANALVVKLPLLRERDFGSLECTPWSSGRAGETILGPDDTNYIPRETARAMDARAEAFLDDYLIPLLALDGEEPSCVATVSHGLFLSVLWRSLLARLEARSISTVPKVTANMVPLQYLPAWANTGFLELDICHNIVDQILPADNHVTIPKALTGWKMVVRAVNSKDHLSTLKRTRGGLGSATFDAKQKNLDGFFKKPKVQSDGPG